MEPLAWMTGGQLPLCPRSCPPGDAVFTEDSSYNPNCHLAGHANEMGKKIPNNIQLLPSARPEHSYRTGEVGHQILETTLPFQSLSLSLGVVGNEKSQEKAEGRPPRQGSGADGGCYLRHRAGQGGCSHQVTVFVYRFGQKLFCLLARSVENGASLKQTYPHP